MKYFFTTAILISICSLSLAQTKSLKPEQIIEQIFDGLSEGEISKIESVVTSDFRLLEHGEVWTIDTVRTYLAKKRPADFKRVNFFDFFQSEVTDKMAFVSYHNRADIHANNQDRTIKWLESAVFVKERGAWKLKMLHSTRIETK